MTKHKVLLQWIGHSDLRAMAASLPAAPRDEIMKHVKGELPKKGDCGPIKTLLLTQSFDEVRLLSNYAATWNKKFVSWLGTTAEVVSADLRKPTDYQAIFKIADAELAEIRRRKDWGNIELCIHLSPGTPAMAAIWLLLGKTRYPAIFYETFGGKSWITEVPFDLTIDVLPEILRDPDNHIGHLAAESPSQVEGFQDIVGDSPAIRDAVGRAKRVAIRGVSVLILGESGTGKELFARAMHRASPRRDEPLVAINCAALSKTLLESELFGHVKGAFTDAHHDRKGAFEEAHGGTLFLDEIGECDVETQAKLLRALQPIGEKGPCIRKIRRLGGDKDEVVDVRIIAATNRDLHRAVRERTFRDDLYYRLAAVTITLPPLRDRKSDILAIAERLLTQINEQFAKEDPQYQHKSFSDTATAFVKRHDWPGNVRQLHNVLVQAAALAEGDRLGRGDLVAALGEVVQGLEPPTAALERPLGGEFDLDEYLNQIHRHYLRRAMKEAQGQSAKGRGAAEHQALSDARQPAEATRSGGRLESLNEMERDSVPGWRGDCISVAAAAEHNRGKTGIFDVVRTDFGHGPPVHQGPTRASAGR